MEDLDQKIRLELIKLLKDNKVTEADDLFKKSYTDNQAKQIELGFFYSAIRRNLDIAQNVDPSKIEEQVIKYMEIN